MFLTNHLINKYISIQNRMDKVTTYLDSFLYSQRRILNNDIL